MSSWARLSTLANWCGLLRETLHYSSGAESMTGFSATKYNQSLTLLSVPKTVGTRISSKLVGSTYFELFRRDGVLRLTSGQGRPQDSVVYSRNLWFVSSKEVTGCIGSFGYWVNELFPS